MKRGGSKTDFWKALKSTEREDELVIKTVEE